MIDVRSRFPGIVAGEHQGWARFDGPAGTQVVDAAIEASAAWQRSGNNANAHGVFAASEACDALVDRTRRRMGDFLHADPGGFVFGPSTTANVLAVTRAIAHDLRPGDEIICTRLDHDSNIAPWMLAAEDTGAVVRLADFDAESGRMPTSSVTDLLTDRTTWVAVTGASNAIGTMPDIVSITRAVHDAGARMVVDGVHLVPHAPVDLAAIGCDIFSTSAYKWYGPHTGITWIEPELLDRLHAYKVRPAPARGPSRFETGTLAFEQLAAVHAAVDFLLDIGMERIGDHERHLFDRLLGGLLADERVTVYGPHDLDARAPTLAFNVAGHHPHDVAGALADEQIAVWDGDYYALELMANFGIAGAVRAGITAYLTIDDVDRLLDAVARL